MKRQARAEAIAEKRTERESSRKSRFPDSPTLKCDRGAEGTSTELTSSAKLSAAYTLSKVIGARSVRLREGGEEIMLRMLSALSLGRRGGPKDHGELKGEGGDSGGESDNGEDNNDSSKSPSEEGSSVRGEDEGEEGERAEPAEDDDSECASKAESKDERKEAK